VVMTCLENEAGQNISVEAFAQQCQAYLEKALQQMLVA